jgi:hypothetical protein
MLKVCDNQSNIVGVKTNHGNSFPHSEALGLFNDIIEINNAVASTIMHKSCIFLKLV